MLALIDERLSQIEPLCRKHHVVQLELFGSGARADFDQTKSDLDFLVRFEDLGWVGASDRYFGLFCTGWRICSTGVLTWSNRLPWPTPSFLRSQIGTVK